MVVGLRAFNRFGVSDTRSLSIRFGDPELVSTLAGSGGQQGVALAGHSIVTTGGLAPYACGTTPATGSLPPGVVINADCTLSGTPAQGGTFDFTVDVTDSSVGPGGPDPFTQRSGTLSLVVAPALVPTISAAFQPGSIPADGAMEADLVLTITNPNAIALSGVAVAGAALPDNLAGRGAGGTSSCGGTVSYASAGRILAFSGGSVAANGTCTVRLPVSTTVAGVYGYTTGAVSSAESGAGGTASTATGLTAVTAAATVAVVSGDNQTATISTAFAAPLLVIVRDFADTPMAGVTVSFAVPNAGASGVLGADSAVTDANGLASVTATANATAGTYAVVATAAGVAQPASFTLSNGRAAQVIAFTAPPAQSFVPGATVDLVATGGASGLPVTFASATPAVCSVSGTQATILGAGTCVVTASQAGNANYAPAADVTGSFAIGAGAQIISFTPPPAQSFVPGATVDLVATGGASGLPVTFASTTPAVCSVSGTQATILGAGTCTVTASQAGNDDYLPAADVTASFAIGAAPQVISFTPPPSQTFVPGATVDLVATGGASGLPVTFASTTPAVCSVSGTQATILGAGTCTVTASQAGSANYAAADPVERSFAIGQAAQIISFTPPPAQTFVPGATVDLVATGGASGLPVTFASTTPAVCAVSGTRATILGAGTCVVTASQAGSANYAPAADVTAGFAIGAGAQVIDFPDPGPQVLGQATRLRATATSGLPVGFASETPAVCMVSGDLLTQSAAGLCIVTADQPGNADWQPAPTVRRAFGISAEDRETQAALLADLQRVRARNLILLQPDLSSLLDRSATPNGIDLSFSTKGGDFDLFRMDGPLWFRLAGSRTTGDDGASDHYAQLSFGRHMEIGPDAILGLMATFDTIRQTQASGEAEGEGWLVGPYVVARMEGSNLTFEGRALFGRTSDSITETGWAPQDVAGKRALLMLKASARIARDGLELRPYLRFAGVSQTSDPYLTAAGVAVSEVRSHYVQGTLGVDFDALHKLVGGDILRLHGGFGLSVTDDSHNGASEAVSIRLGVTRTFGEVWTLDAEVTGNADSNGARTFGLSLGLNARF